MFNRETVAPLDPEAGSHTADIEYSANADYQRHITSQNHGSARGVRSGSQSSGPVHSATQMSTNASKSSIVHERGHTGLKSGPLNARSASWATEDDIMAETFAIRPRPDITSRAGTFEMLQPQKGSTPPPRENAKKILCIPRLPKRAKEKVVLDGEVELDAEKPGPWVVDHHRSALVLKIAPAQEKGYLQRMTSCFGTTTDKSHLPYRTDRNGEKEDTFRVSFAEMQRMHLRKLQVGLVKHAVTMYATKDETENWEKDLATYVQAMKDYDYMTECSKRPRDYFLATGERNTDCYVTRRVMKDVLGRHDQLGSLDGLQPEDPLGPWEYNGEPIGGTRNRTLKALSFKDFRDRLFLATVGAALLLGPMWLMVLHNTLYTGLVATTVCVAVFGLVVVFRLDKPMDVLSSTAAYAAVLVVFVGLTTESSVSV